MRERRQSGQQVTGGGKERRPTYKETRYRETKQNKLNIKTITIFRQGLKRGRDKKRLQKDKNSTKKWEKME